MTREAWLRLAVRAGAGAAVGAALVLVGPLMWLRFHPALAPAAGIILGVLWWAFSEFAGPQPCPQWEQPFRRETSAYVQSDVRTRRLAHALKNAQPGQGFEARRVAGQLADLTARRLVASGRLDEGAPLEHAAAHLSPALLSYLHSATGDRPAVLSRKSLRSHLKEIDSL